MKNALFIPQPGFRFYFKEHPDYIFEIGSVTYNDIRYAAIAGGKSFSISPDDFENRYTSGEILCVFAPDKLIINPKHDANIFRISGHACATHRSRHGGTYPICKKCTAHIR